MVIMTETDVKKQNAPDSTERPQKAVLIKNSIEVMKTKVLPPNPSVVIPKESEKTKGRMFRHRLSFQESTEPTPNVSRVPSMIRAKYPGNGTPKSQLSTTGISSLNPLPRVSSLPDDSKGSVTMTSATLRDDEEMTSYSRMDSRVASRENLCLPSLLSAKVSLRLTIVFLV
jgi:hypothetical protein